MRPMPAAQPITAREYLELPLLEPSARRELVEGEVVMHSPLLLHQLIGLDLLVALRAWTRSGARRGLVTPHVDVLIDEHNVFQPDILWYSEGHAPKRGDDRPYPVPALAVEIRSPSTWSHDVGAKKTAYERNGLSELWLLDTAADAVLAFRRSAPEAPSFDVALELARSDTLSSSLLPGFELRLAELFGQK